MKMFVIPQRKMNEAACSQRNGPRFWPLQALTHLRVKVPISLHVKWGSLLYCPYTFWKEVNKWRVQRSNILWPRTFYFTSHLQMKIAVSLSFPASEGKVSIKWNYENESALFGKKEDKKMWQMLLFFYIKPQEGTSTLRRLEASVLSNDTNMLLICYKHSLASAYWVLPTYKKLC